MKDLERPLLVLIHGWGFDCGVFQGLTKVLEISFRIQTVNLPGYAGQPMVSNYLLTDIVNILSDKVTEPAIYLGWSMGGLITLELAFRSPEKVKKLILLTSTPCFAKKDDWAMAMDRSILENFISAYNKEPDHTLDKFSYLATEGNRSSRNWIRALRELSSQVDPRALEKGLEILLHSDLRSAVSTLTMPAFMIFGENDPLVPVGVEQEIRNLNDAIETQIISNAGHTPFLTNTDLIAERIYEFAAG